MPNSTSPSIVDGSLPVHAILYVNLLPVRLLSVILQLFCLGMKSSSFPFLATQMRTVCAGIDMPMPGISIFERDLPLVVLALRRGRSRRRNGDADARARERRVPECGSADACVVSSCRVNRR